MVKVFKALGLVYLLLILNGCSVVSFRWDNDVVNKGSDQNYTNGLELKGSLLPKQLYSEVRDILDLIPTPRLKDEDPSLVRRYNVGLKQDIYTPGDLSRKDIIKSDNPYAGSLTLDTEKVIASNKFRISSKIRVGTTGGPSLADITQTTFHATSTSLGRPQRHPEGWHNQISDFPLLNIESNRSWEDRNDTIGPIQYATMGSLTARLGNIHTDMILQYGLRLGHNLPLFDRSTSSKSLSVYTFGHVFSNPQLINVYYDGVFFKDSPHTIDKEWLVSGIKYGFGVEYDQYALKFTYQTQTRDYRAQQPYLFSFGLLSLGVDW